MSIRIVLADDHDVVRAGVRTILERMKNVEVVGEARDGRDALRLVRELSPDLVLMDIAMPDLNGLEATRQVVADGDGVKVIVLSMHTDRRFVCEVLQAGASGYVLKDCACEELGKAIGTVSGGRVYLSPGITEIVVSEFIRTPPAQRRLVVETLSPKEREVLQLLAEGKTSKEIAAALFLSPKTVESHRGQIMDKLGLRTVAELTKFAIREGLTSVDH